MRAGWPRGRSERHGGRLTIEPEGKLRAFLRFPLTRLFVAFGAIALFVFPIFAASNAAHLHGLAAAGLHLIAALGGCGIYVTYVRLVERRSPSELALRDLLPQLARGFLIGTGLFSVTIIILAVTGSYTVSGVNAAATPLAFFIGALGAALLEEIAVRGVLFRIMEQSLGTWIALALSAVIFGLLHGVNPGTTWRDLVGLALGAGVFLAAVFVYARQLWIGIGLHCAWNFNEAGVFGGSGKTHSLLSAKIQGPAWWTGGDSGLDASVLEMFVCLTATIIFLLLARRHGRIVAPFWSKAKKNEIFLVGIREPRI
jgi:membrane protease YdiL (CAAX protease family)